VSGGENHACSCVQVRFDAEFRAATMRERLWPLVFNHSPRTLSKSPKCTSGTEVGKW